MDWYYSRSGMRFGPVRVRTLSEMIARGELSGEDLVWGSGMESWARVQDVPQLAFRPDEPAPPDPGAASVQGYAGFWKRLAAYVLDLLFFAGFLYYFLYFFHLGGSLSGQGGDLSQREISLMGNLLGWLYFAFLESSRQQATVGKLILGVEVTDLKGRRISFGRATARYLGKILSIMTLGVGYFMAGLTARKQALHDLLAGCLVVRRQSP